ncbi:hypothetical protein H9L17_15680 [Thermomonas brevis]|uniref:Uncharacterized protein n=1 Tax=Thermomonas brevis TaxID=215691 RepID=A0A7G9QTA1_9GAMM|nr:hypothetical protein [Thermomonas brevis]QNN46576.1 hypothetical protein H9L17_15680 [Thermomonas brevis]
MKAFVPVGMVVAALLALPAAKAGEVKDSGNAMPSRLSMSVTTAKQTQGKTFGEKVASGLQSGANAVAQGIEIGCAGERCAIVFPDGEGFRADLAELRLTPLDEAERRSAAHWGDPHVNASGRAIGQGASLLGGALPGAGIVSAAVSGVGGMDKPGGAVSSSYAAGRAIAAGDGAGKAPVDLAQPLADGDYELAVVVEKATSGLKDTLKTNVRLAAPSQVRIVLGFSVRGGVVKARHDTAKNSISNLR